MSSETQTHETLEGGTAGTPEVQSGSEADAPHKANKEARYRVERNEARAALVSANSRIERMQRAEIERVAADALSHPADLFTMSGNELADYLTEDGEVDADKVAADVAAILAERPGLQKPKHPAGYDPTQGHGGRPEVKLTPTWDALFQDH